MVTTVKAYVRGNPASSKPKQYPVSKASMQVAAPKQHKVPAYKPVKAAKTK